MALTTSDSLISADKIAIWVNCLEIIWHEFLHTKRIIIIADIYFGNEFNDH